MSVPASLERRVQALEQQLAQLAGQAVGEALQANYLTTDAAGNVGADFTGHVHAQGLDLDADTVAGSTDDHKVRWLRQTDGSVVAEIFAYEAINTGWLDVSALADPPDNSSEVDINARDTTATVRSTLGVSFNPTRVYTQINVLRVLLDNLNKSNFMQCPLVAQSMTWGVFTTGTNAINVAGSNDWTVGAPSGVGFSQLTFPTRAAVPTILATIQQDGTFNGYAELNGAGAGTVQIATLNGQTAPPVLKNAIVHFVVIG